VRRILMLLAVAALMAAVIVASAMPAFAVKGGFPHSDSGWGSGFKKSCSALGGSYGKERIDGFAGQTCLIQEGPPEG
jgi:hypothetical protein